MDLKKCCCTLFWGGIIVYLHIIMNGETLGSIVKKVKPKVVDTIDNLKK